MSTGKCFGYGRVSTRDQNPQLQIDALIESGCHPSDIYIETISSRRLFRPELEKVMSKLESGDTLIAWKLDRIGRSVVELIHIIEQLNSRNVNLRILTGSLKVDTSTAQGKLMFHIVSAFAEYERELIRERSIAGQKAAVKNGAVIGRPRCLSDKDLDHLIKMSSQGISVKEICKFFEISKTSYYRYLKSVDEKPII